MGTKQTTSSNCGRPTGHRALTGLTAGLAMCLSPLLVEQTASAQEFRLHAEPAAYFWADKAQSDRWGPGLGLALRPGITLGKYVSLQASWTGLAISPGEDVDHAGSAHFIMGGVRFRPLASFSPERGDLAGLFVDGNAGYARTGSADRFAFDTGLGYNFPVKPWLAIGPVLRYTQIVQRDDVAGKNPDDAQLISGGVNFTFGPSKPYVAPSCPECATCADCPPQVVVVREEPAPVATAAPDRDRDGVLDSYDRCPTQYGPRSTFGCPVDPCSGQPLSVLVQFPFDSARLPTPRDDDPTSMDPVLDEIAGAIAQDTSCRVCIIGHASEEGEVAYNLDLSEQRAESVSDYLTARGLADRKMPSIGMGVACQLEPKTSLELNRRVSFVRLLEGESCPTTCPD